MEALSGTLPPTLNFSSEALKVLLVCYGHELSDSRIVFDRVKGLKPLHFRAVVFGFQRYGQEKVRPVKMLDLEHLIGSNARETAFVRVAFAIRPVHR